MARNNIQKVIFLGLATSLAMSLNILESAMPIPAPFPGAKLGLANAISLLVIIRYGLKEAILVNILRTILTSLLIGTLFTPVFFLSFSGGLVSAIVMGLVYVFLGKQFSLIGISVLGAVTHSTTQVLVASYIVDTAGIFLHLPYLLVFSLPTGVFVGMIVRHILPHLRFG